MGNQIHAILVDRNLAQRDESLIDWRGRERRDDNYRRINEAQRLASGRNKDLKAAEAEMARIQSELGFRDVTAQLTSDNVTPIPYDQVRFKVGG